MRPEDFRHRRDDAITETLRSRADALLALAEPSTPVHAYLTELMSASASRTRQLQLYLRRHPEIAQALDPLIAVDRMNRGA